MTPERLASLAAYAGPSLHPDGPSGPHPFGPGAGTCASLKVIYVVCAWSGAVLYVGSTTAGTQVRFAQHLKDTSKTLDWSTVWLIPLEPDTPVADVRRIEGRVGLAARPTRSKALPRLS